MVYQSVQEVSATDLAQPKRVMLFDLEDVGHHAIYIRHLISNWNIQNFSSQLVVLVTPTFLERHGAMVALAQRSKQANVTFQSISATEEADLRSLSQASRLSLRFQELQLLNQYIRRLEIDHCLIMFIDKLQIPFLLGSYPSCAFSGIYFRPSFHYTDFLKQSVSWRTRLQNLRERIFLYRLLRNSQLCRLLCLDPFVSDSINQITKTHKALTLCDPIDMQMIDHGAVERIRCQLMIERHRKVFLIFGELSARKGIVRVLEALETLDSSCQERICLLIVGRITKAEDIKIAARIERLVQQGNVQIVTHYEFVPDNEVQAYFEMADVVLALYQQHVGMSGILLLAAKSRKPVLSADYGLMGELVRRYGLGLTVDSGDAEAIAQQLVKLAETDLSDYFDPVGARRLVKDNTVEQFTNTIFKVLLASR